MDVIFKFQPCIRISMQLTLQELLKFIEPKEYVIAKPAHRLVVAISKDFCLKTVGFFAFSEGIATPVFALARNDSVYRLLDKLQFIQKVRCFGNGLFLCIIP